MYKAIAAATNAVLDVIRTSLKDSILVVLGPGQGILQSTTMVLIQGSLEPAYLTRVEGRGNPGGPFVASSNEGHVAPSVMVWVSDYFEGQLVSQKELEVVAGPRGATLLLWGIKPEDLLLPSPKEMTLGTAPTSEAEARPGAEVGPVAKTGSAGLRKVKSGGKVREMEEAPGAGPVERTGSAGLPKVKRSGRLPEAGATTGL